MKILSVIIPAYNEEKNIPPLLQRLRTVVEKMTDITAEFIFVDDHSSDKTPYVIEEENKKDPRVKLLRLSRNTGSHTAIHAGLCHATGNIAVTISADLQDPPEMIPDMYEKVLEGKQIVWAVRGSRSDGLRRRIQGSLYHRFFKTFILPAYPKKGTDHFMITGVALDALRKSPEKNTSLMGLVCWMGFEQDQIFFHRDQRMHGHSKWTFSKTFKLLVDSLISFSYLPIRMMSVCGFLMAFVGFIYIVWLLSSYFFFSHRAVEGWASLMVVIVFVSGMQMMMLGILGEYLWRIFEEVRRRPLYIVEKSAGFNSQPTIHP
jgi:glycosyltransferase involved in cell wall biosynthesis